MTSIADTAHADLWRSLIVILKFTAWAEGAGTLLLTILFRTTGDPVATAFWRGLFTSVSAFCNAGFALQSDSLMPFGANALLLQAISVLIIAGGMAPAICLFLPRMLAGKEIPVGARIALVTTAVLLVSGTFLFLAFEWEGALTGMPIVDKVNNAWFQSVTLRTAGFNSVPIAQVTGPTLLLMLIMMFIGGSPGGTAGGIKTTTIAVLAMTFWATVTGRGAIIIRNRRIPSGTVYRAVTITFSGIILWAVVVVMLEATQRIAARDIIFEATSALATVGLSTGATARLDEIGKIIIMIAMFAGRIGPMTLFMLLGSDRSPSGLQCPEAKINLT